MGKLVFVDFMKNILNIFFVVFVSVGLRFKIYVFWYDFSCSNFRIDNFEFKNRVGN